jgi:hypothetical protein
MCVGHRGFPFLLGDLGSFLLGDPVLFLRSEPLLVSALLFKCLFVRLIGAPLDDLDDLLQAPLDLPPPRIRP